MNSNIRIAKELIRFAKDLISAKNDDPSDLEIASKKGKKYILHHKENNLWRIQACRIVGGSVDEGEFGGLIESEKNLSQQGECWVDDGAKVYGNAKVYGDGWIGANAKVYDNAEVFGRAFVYEDAKVYGNAKVYGDAEVCRTGKVYDNARVYDSAKVFDASASGDAKIYGDARIYYGATVDYEVSGGDITTTNSKANDPASTIPYILDELKEGNGYGIILYDPLWLEHKEIENAFIHSLDKLEDVDDRAIESLLKNNKIVSVIAKGIRDGNCHHFFEHYIDKLSRNPEIMKGFAESLDLDFGIADAIVRQHTSLLRDPQVCQVAVAQMGGDIPTGNYVYDCIVSDPFILEIGAIYNAFISHLKDGDFRSCYCIERVPNLLEQKAIRDVFVENLRNGNKDCAFVVKTNKRLRDVYDDIEDAYEDYLGFFR